MCRMRASLLALAATLALAACATPAPRPSPGGAAGQPGGPDGPVAPRTEPAVPRPTSAPRPGAPARADPPAPPAPPAAAPGEPAYLAPGWTRPRERSEGCVERAVAAPPGLWGAGDPITLKFAVRADGRVDSFQCITSIEDGQAPAGTARRFVRQLEAAVLGCAFEPGRDPAGRPAAMWRFLSVRPAPARDGAR